jgi:hypothetical protein
MIAAVECSCAPHAVLFTGRTAMIARLLVILVLPLIAACSENYGSAGTGGRILGGGGYKEKQISSNSWEVEYNATSYKLAFDWALYRSAEIAQNQGYAAFTAVQKSSQSVPIYSGTRYVGLSWFVTLTMQGYRDRAARCTGQSITGSTARCDLYDTAQTLDRLAR